MFRTSIATVSLSGDLKEKLVAISAAGFDGVEIFENDFLAYPAGAADVGMMVRDAGLRVTVFQPFRDFEGLPEPQRGRAFDRAERKFDVMQALGTDLMLVCSNVSPLALGGIDRAAEDLRRLGERASGRGLRIGFEALAWGRHISDHRDAWEVVRRADHPALGLILDSFHTLALKVDPESIRRIPGDRIFLVQLADAPILDMDLLSWSRHFRNMPGQGELELSRFLSAVEATGYSGYLSLEIFNDQFRAGSARQVAVDGRRSLIAALDQVARQELQPSKGRPDRVELVDRVKLLGTEFIEFAVDDESGAELAEIFAAMGFARRGRHVSKEVEWWGQGEINLVINSEREGFAHASYITHGPSVCAIGLRVEDAEAAMARARALLAQPFRQAVGPGELELPAIRGVGGSLIYFTDPESELARVWDIEFRPDADQGGHADGERNLQSVDHISQSMNYDEMLSWLLFYTSIFAMERTPQLDITDPGGLVRSQVVEGAQQSVRIALNGSQSSRTLSGRFLAEFFGSGVQHIAFASRDIFRVAETMKQGGLRLLEVPENYYDDLEAKFDLGSEQMARLRHSRVLYDRDEGGEFFQLYTAVFADRFFFEVVQRRNDYRGYGAANAPIRLASQARSSRHPAVPRR